LMTVIARSGKSAMALEIPEGIGLKGSPELDFFSSY